MARRCQNDEQDARLRPLVRLPLKKAAAHGSHKFPDIAKKMPPSLAAGGLEAKFISTGDLGG
jgi:hypothetical protein